ncbi:uncharacterized protein LOC134762999 [Penaeus indicus]|uniref:uncharacterized protein LOC134762999 n=1 Tax=Penaeus indicus TaxID=29960 RepID=UPI00300D03A9
MQSTPKTRLQANTTGVVRIGSIMSRPKRVSDSPTPKNKMARKTLASIKFSPEQKKDELFRAAEEGDLDVVKELIEDTGPEVREEDSNATLLHAAAANGHVDLVIFLLTLISPNTTDNNGQTPVHVAARKGQLPALEVLLKDEQFNAERLDNSNRSFKDLLSVPLVEAVLNWKVTTLTRLLELGADPDHKLAGLVDSLLARELSVTTPRELAISLSRNSFVDKFNEVKPPTTKSSATKKAKDFSFSISRENIKYGPLRVTVTPATKISRGPDIYKMDTDPRGFVCILNYNSFKDRPDLSLEGADNDILNLENVFGTMGYTGNTYSNLTAEKTKAALSDIRELDILDEIGCIVFIISSHGIGGENFLTSDMQLLDAKWLYSSFRDSECPQLQNKPKLFIFDICNGYYRNDAYQAKPTEFIAEDEPCKDMVCIYSSSTGITSYTFTKDGTPFITSLCRTLATHAHNKEFGDLYRMFLLDFNRSNPTTVPEMRNLSFAKKFFFNP